MPDTNQHVGCQSLPAVWSHRALGSPANHHNMNQHEVFWYLSQNHWPNAWYVWSCLVNQSYCQSMMLWRVLQNDWNCSNKNKTFAIPLRRFCSIAHVKFRSHNWVHVPEFLAGLAGQARPHVTRCLSTGLVLHQIRTHHPSPKPGHFDTYRVPRLFWSCHLGFFQIPSDGSF